uniref:Tex_N domain-containing protein n=1 Tax=Mesocestoides corti TaxID=53468 RepID=A0A5K3FRC7_MESCO
MEPMDVDWDVVTEVAASTGTDNRTASRVINLLNDGNTLPFIARYRKEATGNMEPEALRLIKAKLTSYREVIDKVENAFKHLTSRGVMTEDLKKSLRQCKTVTDVALIMEPFKETGPKTLAAKARAAGLEPVAYAVFRFGKQVNFNTAVADLSGPEVESGVMNIMADMMCRDLNVLREVERLCLEIPPKLCTTRIPPPQIPPKNKPLASGGRSNYEKDVLTFQAYFDFSMPFNRIAPHRVSWCQ